LDIEMAPLGQFERTSAGKAYPSAFGLGDVDQASTIRPAVPDGLNSVDERDRRITSKDEEARDILEQRSQIDFELLRLDGDGLGIDRVLTCITKPSSTVFAAAQTAWA
jgi:hypothetical protein